MSSVLEDGPRPALNTCYGKFFRNNDHRSGQKPAECSNDFIKICKYSQDQGFKGRLDVSSRVGNFNTGNLFLKSYMSVIRENLMARKISVASSTLGFSYNHSCLFPPFCWFFLHLFRFF